MCGNHFSDMTASYIETFSKIRFFFWSFSIHPFNKYLWSTYSVQSIILSGLLRQIWHKPWPQRVCNLAQKGAALLLTTVWCKQAMCDVRDTMKWPQCFKERENTGPELKEASFMKEACEFCNTLLTFVATQTLLKIQHVSDIEINCKIHLMEYIQSLNCLQNLKQCGKYLHCNVKWKREEYKCLHIVCLPWSSTTKKKQNKTMCKKMKERKYTKAKQNKTKNSVCCRSFSSFLSVLHIERVLLI